jgi:putative addiction module component (TIGR02574 family)
MAMTLDDLTTAALQLSPILRAELVERLIVSLHGTEDIHPEWSGELDRRDAEMDRDPGLGRPADEVFRRLRARLAE